MAAVLCLTATYAIAVLCNRRTDRTKKVIDVTPVTNEEGAPGGDWLSRPAGRQAGRPAGSSMWQMFEHRPRCPVRPGLRAPATGC